jgi:cell division protein FtsA
MEITKITAALEITSDYAKFAVGYSLTGAPVLLYFAKKPIKAFMKDGEMVNAKAITDVLASFLKLDDEALRLKINASEVSIVIPPLGFEVYQNNKTTNVVGEEAIIHTIDIGNVMSLVKKEPVPNGNVIVDIVPDAFVLENGKMYANPPIGEKSDSLTIEAKVHTLPDHILYAYRKAAEDAGFRVDRTCVATYCASQLISCLKNLPASYLYVDMGAHITAVSLVGNSSPFGSLFFLKGGDDLTQDIADAFGIPFEEAEKLKLNCGYDLRETKYQSPLATSVGEDGKSTPYFQKDLNSVIEDFFESYDGFLNNAIQTILNKQPANPALLTLPILVSGGASKLNGLEALIASVVGKRPLTRFVPPVLGARDPGATNLLGLIVAEGSYHGTLEDNYHGVSTLSRDKQ